MPFSENTGTRPNLTVSSGRPRVLGPNCAPSTLSRGMYPGLVGIPRAHTPFRRDWMLVTRLRLTRCDSRRTRPYAFLGEHGHPTKSYRFTRATPSTQTRLCSEHPISGNVPRTSRNPLGPHSTPPGLDASDPTTTDQMRFSENTTRCHSRKTRPVAFLGEYGHPTKSYRFTRATSSTQTRLCSEHPISGNVPRTSRNPSGPHSTPSGLDASDPTTTD
ncbi:hypothetical protein TIFTF001_042560 [Ficus carica]|uniref:Uncharacterized protein n=1 Tax=Ficus carica TaxID=3494 RepID=A0AA87ZP18_FICCA|nr:hypothetical protein TIFTF001_040042 [Ficus carica]GMN21440.1 hypothetical protein TIFTF001_040046 [Ficus carica]GMN36994.1 hypothetical protein TIFTF001_042555 [Ficus carica]GMN37011.1 hypothetical protein TIFTF001_042560 [Ficus carica]